MWDLYNAMLFFSLYVPSPWRILSYVKAVKFIGVFGQYGIKWTVCPLWERHFWSEWVVSENVPIFLKNTELVVVIEPRENLNIIREFSIKPDKMYRALQWLVENNPLYLNIVAHRTSQQWRTKIAFELSK